MDGSWCASDTELGFCSGELCDGEFEILSRVRGADLRADARLSVGHDRIRKADDVNAAREHGLRETLGQRRFAEHDRHDGMCAGQDAETARGHRLAEILGVGRKLPAACERLFAASKDGESVETIRSIYVRLGALYPELMQYQEMSAQIEELRNAGHMISESRADSRKVGGHGSVC